MTNSIWLVEQHQPDSGVWFIRKTADSRRDAESHARSYKSQDLRSGFASASPASMRACYW